MSHRAKLIVDAITNKITGLPTTGQNVEQSRVWAVTRAPALTVRLGPMVQTSDLNQLIDQTLTIYIDIHVKAHETRIDDDVLQIHQELWQAIKVHHDLGLDYVIDTSLTELSEPILNGESDQPTAKATLTIEVRFRHAVTHPGA